MPKCEECKNFFPWEDNPRKGDCVERAVDPRQAYYKAKPVNADQDSADCSSFQKK
ncbi:MAG: benzylsuccinate synthase gamma subunit family protein [Deltaproteobacteria bacterium]|jgi:benzylsuccinate synthase|nr:benzylsuccinate synthase gamma subunit family protein [Deltaproteobacteria bacterium]MBN2845773.1 benzylsuccinate synthase gamma subunit family protein [Deltaproteobacteria bacterium]